MPPRRNMADRLDSVTAAGADAFTQTTPAPAPAQPRRGRRQVGDGWEATNKRVTFYCPLDVLEALAEEVAKGERSNSQIIVAGLRAELGLAAETADT